MKKIIVFCCVLLSQVYALYANAATHPIVGDTAGEMKKYTAVKGDTIYTIARKFDLGVVEVLAANKGITPKTLTPGTELIIPTLYIIPDVYRKGIVINLAELRLYNFLDDGSVMTFPIGIGKEGWQTPTGDTRITLKRENPTWTPPESIRAENPELPESIPPGPKNPLGKYAMSLGISGIAIHGTNKPNSIGLRASHGCIRMYPEDIESLFHAVSEGTDVDIIDQNYKVGWHKNTLLLEVTPTQKQTDVIARYKQSKPVSIPELHDTIKSAAGDEATIDTIKVQDAVDQHAGVPIVLFVKS